MRLDKYLCESTELTRSLARRCVRRGQVTVNGEITKKADLQVQPGDRVQLDEQELFPRGTRYLMLHKPAGYVCSGVDDNLPSALSLLQEERADLLHFAGRLDADTTGLVLLTDDGQWSHRITSPRSTCWKHYRVGLANAVTKTDQQAFETGVSLKGDSKPTLPAKLAWPDPEDPYTVDTWISEGRYHQIKRMFAALGNHVETLHRLGIGDITLDPHLEEGEARPLTEDEIARF